MPNEEIEVKTSGELFRGIDYLQSIVQSLRERRVCVEHEQQSMELHPPDDGVSISVKVRQKEDKASIALKISWRTTPTAEDDPGLTISSRPQQVTQPASDD